MNRSLIMLPVLSVLALLGCKGDKGDKGDVGPQGNANVGLYSYSRNLADYVLFTATNTYGVAAPSSVPSISSNQATITYVSLVVAVNNLFEWVQTPYTHYFNSGNASNFHSQSVDNGTVWLYIRNSTGGQPYTSMTGSIAYKTFIMQSSMLQEAEDEGVDLSSMKNLTDFLDSKGVLVEAR